MLGVSRYAVFLVVLVCSYTVYAQESQSDTKRLTDLRVGLVHAALQLTPEQEKYWPALEEAIRARSAGRLQRWLPCSGSATKGCSTFRPLASKGR